MKRNVLAIASIICLSSISYAQTASSLESSPAVENSMMGLFLDSNDKGAISIYPKLEEQMEFSRHKGCMDYFTDKTFKLGSIALWDGEKEQDFSISKDYAARVGRTAHGNYAEILTKGISYKGKSVDISLRVDVVDKSRHAIITATCTSGDEVQFVISINVDEGMQTATGKGWISTWEGHGRGLRYSPVLFPEKSETDSMISIISAPATAVRAKIVSASAKEQEIRSSKPFTRHVKGMTFPTMTEELGGEIDNIAYSRLDDKCPINTIEHFEKAVEYGFSRLKTDMQITKDGEIVLCHDNGFTLNKQGTIARFDRKNTKGKNIVIKDMTLSEVKSLKHEEFHKEMGHYGHVATLEEFFRLCKKHNIPMYTTLRNYYQEETMQRYARLVKKYKVEPLIMMNNYVASDESLAIVRKYFPTIPYSYTINHSDTHLSMKMIDKIAADGNCIISIAINDADAIPDEVWDYAREKGVLIYGHFVNTREQYLHGIEKGMAGFQISKKACLNL